MINKIPNTWCPLPWNHLSIKTSGQLRLCCHSNSHITRALLLKENGDVYTVHDDFDEAFNSGLIKDVRKKLLNNEWPDVCKRCKDEHNSGLISRNNYERDRNPWTEFEECKTYTNKDGSIDKQNIKRYNIDMRFGNHCNLKCIMCNPTESNKWYDDHFSIWNEGINDIKLNIPFVKKDGKVCLENNPFIWYKNEAILDKIKEAARHTKHIHIAGGEPLISKEHFEFLQFCVDTDIAKDISIDYSTNGLVLPQKVLKIWNHFKDILVGVSVDGVDKVNDLIRFPSDWEILEKNLETLDNSPNNIRVHLTLTLLIINYEHLADFLIYLYKKQYKKINNWGYGNQNLTSMHPNHRPLFLNINILPNKMKEEIYQHNIDKLAENGITKQNTNPISQKILDYFDKFHKFAYSLDITEEEKTKIQHKSLKYLDKLDELRDTNWRKVSPLLAKALSKPSIDEENVV